MKEIIEGKKYDTETAEEVGAMEHFAGDNNFENYEEILYQKKNGEFFMYYDGSCLSPYAVTVGSETSGSTGIKPIEDDHAREWVQRHLDADKYEKIFGSVEE